MIEIINAKDINIGKRGKILISSISEVFGELSPESIFSNFGKEISELTDSFNKIFIIGFGKASYNMYAGIRRFIRKNPVLAEIVAPENMEIVNAFDELKILRGTHPETGALSEASTEAIIGDLKGLDHTDLVLVLISGGGSALFEKPEAGFSIDDISRIGKCMMSAGADIREMNAVRGVLSAVKAGKLARILYPATVRAYIISDVIGDDVSVIASGPLSPSGQDREFISRTILKYSGMCGYKSEDLLSRLDESQTDKYFEKVSNTIILRNRDFVNGVGRRIEKLGEIPVVLGSDISGDVVTVSRLIANTCRAIYDLKGHGFWLVAGGETTVHVKGNGMGGRNQELAIRFAMEMKRDERFTIMSIGTDGIDGSSPAMGGILDNNSLLELSKSGIEAYLDNNDTYTLLAKNRSAIITGFTGTNVSDLIVIHYDRL
ncbi:MAG: hypothetical protein B2I17_09985 [Thermoplasmatales archaeon B_DKE]|nr:MAG: hypothetical protein B2I17_09985 [Thermoplasmatales archaeon B_DKE]